VHVARVPVHARDRGGREERAPSREPAACFHDQVADRPRMVVEEELVHGSDLPVRRVDPQAVVRLHTLQHLRPLLSGVARGTLYPIPERWLLLIPHLSPNTYPEP